MGTSTGAEEAGAAWVRVDGRLRRSVTAATYADAIALVVRLGMLFEEHDHHADLTLSWTELTIDLVSHDAGEVTGRDHAMAHRIDEVLET